jgi:hypothetical protein
LAKYLRDEHLKNVTINENTLTLIDEFLTERENSINDELESSGATQDQLLILNYTIRFDNRGYKLDDFSEVKKYYSQAGNVERVIFTLDSELSEKTGRLYGTYFELRLDAKDQNNTFIQVTSDDRDAVDAVFNGLLEIIQKCKNKNNLVRNTWSLLLVQVLGVGLGFILSLIAALKISPYITVENSFVITFIFAFLIFSNTWNFIHQQILRILEYSFPNVRFNRTGKLGVHWLAQGLVAGLVVAFTLLIFGSVSGWIGSILGEYIVK